MARQEAEDRTKTRLSSVSTAIRLLKAFSGEEAEIGISELAKRLKVAKSTVHRLAVTLTAEDLLEQNPETGRYRLGLGLFGLGSLVRHRMDLSSIARPPLIDLRRETNETVLLAVPAAQDIMYIRHQASRQTVRMISDIGVRVPYYCTAAGRAILAFMPEHRISDICAAPMAQLTPKTVTDPAKLRKLLATVQRLGYAIEDEESELGIRAIGAPVYSARGEVVGSITIAGPIQRLSLKALNALADPLLLASQEISLRLGYRPSSVRSPGAYEPD